ncbi:MAG: hypothetical protein GY717_06165, partial [Rhodobacteraceae bacterium]|nr:hypothetical protein [Paracoccaceae bacterium]
MATAAAISCSALKNEPLSSYGNVSVSLEAGDVVIVSNSDSLTSINFFGTGTTTQTCGPIFSAGSCASAYFTAAATATHHVEEAGGGSAVLSCSSAGTASGGNI